MNTPKVEPQPGRRPVYPVDSGADEPAQPSAPQIPPPGSKDDPASDANTEPANHPNDDE